MGMVFADGWRSHEADPVQQPLGLTGRGHAGLPDLSKALRMNQTTHPTADPRAGPATAETSADAAAASAGRTDSARDGRTPPPAWVETLQSIGRELPGLVSDRVDLLSLELQRAGRALAQIVALLVAAAILGVTAWLALWAGVAVGLVQLGLHWSLSLLLVLALNAAVAGLALTRLRLLLPLLGLPATRRHLTPNRINQPSMPADPAPLRAAGAVATPPLGQAG